MIENASHNLKPVEFSLVRDINKLSSEAEKACFNAACGIFIMAHLGTPSFEHDNTTVDYSGA